MLAAFAIFALTITFVIWQPKGLNIAWSALASALLALATGIVSLEDIPVVWNIVWNATATLIAIIVSSLLLDEAGFFEWAALHVARWGRGSGLRLFVLVILLGAVFSCFFANDGAVLILTPLLMAMLHALGFDKRPTIAFVVAAGFIVDSASIPLIVSNLVNIVSADFFGLNFAQYAAVMVPVNLAGIAAALLTLYLYFRHFIPARYDVSRLAIPASAIRDPLTFKAGWIVLSLQLAGFFILEPLGIPVSVLSGAAALCLLLVAMRGRVIDTRSVLKTAPWHIVIFSLAMYLVVYGLKNAGVTQLLSDVLTALAGLGLTWATVGTGFITAFLSSVMNNLPSVLIGALAIDGSAADGIVREGMIYANVIGCDLGPKITPIGSLATLLWLFVLEKKNLTISWGLYFRIGIVLTLPVLLATLLTLSWVLSL